MARYKHLTVNIPPMPGSLLRAGSYNRIDLSREQEDWLIQYFPTTPNCIIEAKSGLSNATLHRHARRLSLVKKEAARTEILQWTYIHKTKPKCIEEGVYERFSHRAKPDRLIEWRRQASANGWHPIKSLREKNPRKYASLMKKRSEARKELERKEALRQKYGLARKTTLHIPDHPFTRNQTTFRCNMKARGYILGDMREEMGERFVIFYDDNTERSRICEAHAVEKGFEVKPLTD